MKNKNTIRIVCAVCAAISIFLITCFLGLLIVKITLGNTAYAVKLPLLLPLSAIAAILTGNIFSFEYEPESEFEEEELKDEPLEDHQAEIYTPLQMDESFYPELFTKSSAEPNNVAFERPDIKQILREQFTDKEEIVSTPTTECQNEEDPLLIFSKDEEKDDSIYMDLPDELPEDYVAYEYEDEEEDDYEDENDASPRIPKFLIRITAAIIAAAAAILLPINCSTVYSSDAITVRRPFVQKKYFLIEAEHYTIGVDLLGDVSMKVCFEGGKEFDLVIPSTTLKSENFKNNFISEYAYAAFCNRLLLRSDIEKRFEDLSSLSPSPALYDKDLAYIAEITEIESNNN